MSGACVNCARRDGLRRVGRCTACYDYRRRHGAERPIAVQLRRFAQPCRGCRRPVGAGRRFGYCPACYMAHRRAGIAMGATA